MNVQESNRTRTLVIAMDRGEELPVGLIRALGEAEARSAWLSGTGALEAAEIAVYDQATHTWSATRRIDTPTTLVSLTGNAAVEAGVLVLHLTVTLARETDTGNEVIAGQLVWARAYAIELCVTAFDDLTLTRTVDERTGLSLLSGRKSTAVLVEPPARTAAAAAAPAPAAVTPAVAPAPAPTPVAAPAAAPAPAPVRVHVTPAPPPPPPLRLLLRRLPSAGSRAHACAEAADGGGAGCAPLRHDDGGSRRGADDPHAAQSAQGRADGCVPGGRGCGHALPLRGLHGDQLRWGSDSAAAGQGWARARGRSGDAADHGADDDERWSAALCAGAEELKS